MKKSLNDQLVKIQSTSGVPFHGTSLEEASAYVDEFSYLVDYSARKAIKNALGRLTKYDKEAIARIEPYAPKPFTGKTRLSAKAYMDTYREHYENAPAEPSDKQKRALSMCKSYLGHEFTGTTNRELSHFLDTYFEAACQEYAIRKAQNELA